MDSGKCFYFPLTNWRLNIAFNPLQEQICIYRKDELKMSRGMFPTAPANMDMRGRGAMLLVVMAALLLLVVGLSCSLVARDFMSSP